MSTSQWEELFKFADDIGVKMFMSVFDNVSANKMNELGMDLFKIGSAEVTRLDLLEEVKSLNYWTQIIKKYSIQPHDSSMINLLYMCINGPPSLKPHLYSVMTKSRELTNYCQESVRPTHSRYFSDALENMTNGEALDLITRAVLSLELPKMKPINPLNKNQSSDYFIAMKSIESILFNVLNV